MSDLQSDGCPIHIRSVCIGCYYCDLILSNNLVSYPFMKGIVVTETGWPTSINSHKTNPIPNKKLLLLLR